MATENPEFWAKAREVRDKIASRLQSHPQVSLIDIGYDPNEGESSDRIVVRVHVRQPVNPKALGLDDEIDGIPVRVVVGDYRAE